MIRLWFLAVCVAAFAPCACGQDMLNPTTQNSPHARSVEVETPAEKAWSFSASVAGYVVPDERDYVQPTVTADRDWLHVEARYNYEDLDTASAWLGYNFAGGEKLTWAVTPMLGGTFGHTNALATGFRGSLDWWKLSLYSEGEFVINPGNSTNNFFYSWSELTLAPVDWMHFGLAAQRTRADHAGTNVQPGVVVGLSYEHAALSVYVFEPYESKPTVVVSLNLSF